MKHGQPMGIMASFSNVSFKKDGVEVFSTKVTSGGCFGPDPEVDVINRGYAELNRSIRSGKTPEAARDFNQVSVGARDYEIGQKGPASIPAASIKRVSM